MSFGDSRTSIVGLSGDYDREMLAEAPAQQASIARDDDADARRTVSYPLRATYQIGN